MQLLSKLFQLCFIIGITVTLAAQGVEFENYQEKAESTYRVKAFFDFALKIKDEGMDRLMGHSFHVHEKNLLKLDQLYRDKRIGEEDYYTQKKNLEKEHRKKMQYLKSELHYFDEFCQIEKNHQNVMDYYLQHMENEYYKPMKTKPKSKENRAHLKSIEKTIYQAIENFMKNERAIASKGTISTQCSKKAYQHLNDKISHDDLTHTSFTILCPRIVSFLQSFKTFLDKCDD